MNLEKLLKQGRVENFDGASDSQIKSKFLRGVSYLNQAKKIFSDEKNNSDTNAFVHTSLYTGLQMISHSYLLANKYRSKGYGQHETIIITCRLLMAKPELDDIYDRLDIMRKNRNKINYGEDLLDVSDHAIKQAIKDISIFAKEVEIFINRNNPQQKLI